MKISQAVGNACTVPASSVETHNNNPSKESKIIYLPGTNCEIKSQALLSAFTSYRVGGAAELYVALAI